MIIYKATNKKNGKIYVGQTVLTLEERKKSHIKTSKLKDITNHFPLAIRKYGIEGFVFEQIDSAETIDELNAKEQKWIEELDTFTNGYNLTTGGNQGGHLSNITKYRLSKKSKDRYKISRHPFMGKKHSEETKMKLSKSKMGIKRGPFTKEHSDNMSKSQKGISKPHSIEWCENQRSKMTGRKHSEESKQKRRDKASCLKIFSPETGKTYNSIVEAALEHGISRGNLSLLVNGKINFLRDKNTGQKLTFKKV